MTKISALPVADAANDSDLIEIVQGGTNRRVTVGQVLDGVTIPTADWDDITGKPATFPPTLPIAESDVTNLVSDLALKAPLASPAFTGTVTSGGFTVGYLDIPQNAQAATYTLVAADAGKHIYHAVAAAAAVYFIPDNASVPYPLGTTLTFVNDSVNAVNILTSTDVLVLSPGTTTGPRTLAVGGVATALKVTATRWLISGTGLT